jgi:hypothetical protein
MITFAMLRLAGQRNSTSQAMADLWVTHLTKLSPPFALQLLLAHQKTMFVAVAISILSHDVAARVDIIQIRRNGFRKIDGRKITIAQQKAMIVAAAVDGAPYDIASRIDPKASFEGKLTALAKTPNVLPRFRPKTLGAGSGSTLNRRRGELLQGRQL